jgi:hypothetical protein
MLQTSFQAVTNRRSANCRRAGSSIGSIIYMFDKTEVKIDDTNGTLKSYKDSDTKSGNSITRQFCSNCGRWVMSDDIQIIT